jgi:hypothetical protein
MLFSTRHLGIRRSIIRAVEEVSLNKLGFNKGTWNPIALLHCQYATAGEMWASTL